MIGAQASNDQLEKILAYIDIGQRRRRQGADRRRAQRAARRRAGEKATMSSRPSSKGNNKMRVFQEEIFGPVRLGDEVQGRGRGARHRQRHALRPGRRRLDARRQHAPTASAARIQAGRVWTNCYHAYPAHAAFGGYTLVGSSNYTRRSYSLDLEANAMIVTRNEGLRRRLAEEQQWLQDYATVVTRDDFARADRRVGFKVRIAMWIVKLVGGAL